MSSLSGLGVSVMAPLGQSCEGKGELAPCLSAAPSQLRMWARNPWRRREGQSCACERGHMAVVPALNQPLGCKLFCCLLFWEVARLRYSPHPVCHYLCPCPAVLTSTALKSGVSKTLKMGFSPLVNWFPTHSYCQGPPRLIWGSRERAG